LEPYTLTIDVDKVNFDECEFHIKNPKAMQNEDRGKSHEQGHSFHNIRQRSIEHDIKQSKTGYTSFESGSIPNVYRFIVDWQLFETEYKYKSESPPVQ